MKGYTALRRGACLVLATMVWSGCGGETPEGQGSENLSPAARPMTAAVQELVNQGNTAQREGRYAEALELYKEAMELEPEHPVPQFGGLMAALALGDSTLASSLTTNLQASAPELLGMLNSAGGMGGAQPEDPHAGIGDVMPGMPPAIDPTQTELPSGHPTLPGVAPDTIRVDTVGAR